MALSGLDNALSGLRIAQLQMNTIASNISNVGTEGYTRKILPQSSVTAADQLIGVRSDTLVRKVDLSLTRDYWTQVSGTNFYDVQARYLNKIQEFHGAPNQEISIAAAVAALKDSFSKLSDSPEDHFLQRTTVSQAQTVVDKINGLAQLITDMRNDAQQEMSDTITRINNLLEQIAVINKQIKFNTVVNKTTASMADTRDTLVKELSLEIGISFFTRNDGIMVVQTKQGQQLVDENATPIYFNPTPVGPQDSYPASAEGIYLGGDPADVPNALDITDFDLSGRLGALVSVRDDIMPRQQAQLDELAHKLAYRFQQQGLTLFTDALGNVPADGTPIPNPPGPLTPVPYVGFANEIQVGQAVQNDHTLVQQGTVPTDKSVQQGSNEVIRRVIEFAFGTVEYQEAVGSIDLRALGSGGTTMQNWLGVYSQNQLTSTVNIASYGSLTAMLTAGGTTFDPSPAGPPYTDTFDITFDDPRLGVASQTYNLSLSAIDIAYPIGPGVNDALDQLVLAINNLAPPTDPAFAVVASRSPYGQLVIESRANITIDASTPALAMGQDGLDFLGLQEGTITTQDPYIEIQVGNDTPVRVTIEPGEDETDFLAKLEYNAGAGTGIPGLYADIDGATGFLTLRPGSDDSNGGPVFGGDIKIVGGPFSSLGGGGSGVPANATMMEALFGTNSPVSDILNSVGAPFRTQNLGPNADLSTGIISSTDLINYSQNMINRHTEEINGIEGLRDDEQNFRDFLQKKLSNDSGVNIEEELSHLIVVQTAFSAAARVVTAVSDMFEELLQSV